MSNGNGKLTVSNKLLLLILVGVLGSLVIARVVMAVAIREPLVHQVECMRDLGRWVELILAAFLGLLAGKATK